MLNTPESKYFTDELNYVWETFEQIEEAFIEAAEDNKRSEADRLHEVMNSYIEWEFEKFHGIQATIRVFLF